MSSVTYHVETRRTDPDGCFFVPVQTTAQGKQAAETFKREMEASGPYSVHYWPCKPGRCIHRA